MEPCIVLQLECCSVKSQWQYQVYYVNDGRKVYYEIWGKNLADYYQRRGRVYQGSSPLEGLEIYMAGNGVQYTD